MYHLHKHGVLHVDHAFLSVFLRVGGTSKSGRAEGLTLILVVQTIGFPVMRRMNHLSELEEYGQNLWAGPVGPRVLSILENSTSWSMVPNAALWSSRISIMIPCWSMLARMLFCTFTSVVSVL